jgi:hypothetical protein
MLRLACTNVFNSYHSCRNRHCPKCQNDKAQEWLATQQDALACTLFHADLHTACGAKRNGAQQPELDVQPALSGFRGCHTAFGKRYPLRWRSGRPDGYPAYLGPQLVLPPAYPLSGSGRRPGSRYTDLAACPKGFLAASQGTLENLPGQVQAGTAKDSPLHAGSKNGWCIANRWAMGVQP